MRMLNYVWRIMADKLNLKYREWIKSLNKFDINHFEVLYIRNSDKSDRSYSNFDIWLFNIWSGKDKINEKVYKPKSL